MYENTLTTCVMSAVNFLSEISIFNYQKNFQHKKKIYIYILFFLKLYQLNQIGSKNAPQSLSLKKIFSDVISYYLFHVFTIYVQHFKLFVSKHIYKQKATKKGEKNFFSIHFLFLYKDGFHK